MQRAPIIELGLSFLGEAEERHRIVFVFLCPEPSRLRGPDRGCLLKDRLGALLGIGVGILVDVLPIAWGVRPYQEAEPLYQTIAAQIAGILLADKRGNSRRLRVTDDANADRFNRSMTAADAIKRVCLVA